LDYAQEAANLSEKLGIRAGLGNALHKIAVVYRFQGYYERSLHYSDSALSYLSEKTDQSLRAAIYSNMIVSSGKALYSMKIQDGEVNYEVDAKNGGVGNVTMILDNNGNVVTIGEKGVSTFNAETGALVAANKYKRASLREYTGNILILETPVQDIAAFDVADNRKYWKYNARKESASSLTDDGAYVYVMEKKTVTKLKTKP